MLGDRREHCLPTLVAQDDHHVERSKRRGGDDQHVDRSNAVGLIAQEPSPSRRGPPRLRVMYLATVPRLISMPSLSTSPWIRRPPHSRLALLMCRIRALISRSSDSAPISNANAKTSG